MLHYAFVLLAVCGLLVCHVDALCGDGVLDAGEECDDGNIAVGDGCNATCAYDLPGACCVRCATGDTVYDRFAKDRISYTSCSLYVNATCTAEFHVDNSSSLACPFYKECECSAQLDRSCCSYLYHDGILTGNDDWTFEIDHASNVNTTRCSETLIHVGYDNVTQQERWIMKRFSWTARLASGINMTSGVNMQLYDGMSTDPAISLVFDIEDNIESQDCTGTAANLRVFRPLTVVHNWTGGAVAYYNVAPDLFTLVNDFNMRYRRTCPEYVTFRVRPLDTDDNVKITSSNFINGYLSAYSKENSATSAGLTMSRIWWGTGECVGACCGSCTSGETFCADDCEPGWVRY